MNYAKYQSYAFSLDSYRLSQYSFEVYSLSLLSSIFNNKEKELYKSVFYFIMSGKGSIFYDKQIIVRK